jgi:precorrin-6A/cobalt-precorrin-6A reductase
VLEALAPAHAAGRLRLVASLAGATRAPRPLPGAPRRGGFGGASGLADWLRANAAAAVIDATHPFAARISANARTACDRLALPRLQIMRPGWPGPARRFPDLAAAAAALPPGARALAATGRASAPDLAGRPDVALWLRVAEPGPLPPGLIPLVARPPRDLPAERALFADLRPTHLLARDAGGPADAKLQAAREAGAQVWLAARPAPEPGPVAPDAAAALAWLESLRLAPAIP